MDGWGFEGGAEGGEHAFEPLKEALARSADSCTRRLLRARGETERGGSTQGSAGGAAGEGSRAISRHQLTPCSTWG